MLHLYTLMVFALKGNKQLLAKSSNKFKALVKQIKTKFFLGKHADLQRHIKFAIKRAVKMVSKHPCLYLINHTMQEEMNFIAQTLLQEGDIKSETPIAHLIPRTPTASKLLAIAPYCLVADIQSF